MSHDWTVFARTRRDRAPTAPARLAGRDLEIGFQQMLGWNVQAFFPVFFTWPTEKWEEKSLSEQKQNGIKNSWMCILGEVQIFVFCTSDCLAKFLFKVPADSYWWLPFSRSHSGCKLQAPIGNSHKNKWCNKKTGPEWLFLWMFFFFFLKPTASSHLKIEGESFPKRKGSRKFSGAKLLLPWN